VSADLGLSAQAEKLVPLWPMRERFRLGAQPASLGGKSVFEDVCLFETTPRHGALLSIRERRSAEGAHITDESRVPGCDAEGLGHNGTQQGSPFHQF